MGLTDMYLCFIVLITILCMICVPIIIGMKSRKCTDVSYQCSLRDFTIGGTFLARTLDISILYLIFLEACIEMIQILTEWC